VTPLEALDRVVYLLDRSLAPAQKVKAFQRAAQVVASLPEGELEQRVAAGTLTDLPGIGSSTGAVITEALAGQVPTRIVDLEATTEVPLSEAGRPYREALRGDCHCHSLWSDGGATVEAMARTAIGLGHDYLVMTDHSPRLTVAHGLTKERLREQLAEIRSVNERLAPFRILTGIEVDILEDGTLDQDPDVLAELDVVVASAHSKLRMDRASMTRRLVLAVASPHVDILGHCTGRKIRSTGTQALSDRDLVRPESAFDAEVVFAACAQFDTAVEINCRPERQDPPDRLLDLALDWGCKVSIDTDAHAPGQLEWQRLGCDKAARHDIALDRIVNTWDADELLDWTESHPAA
jgi:putative hydrolase